MAVDRCMDLGLTIITNLFTYGGLKIVSFPVKIEKCQTTSSIAYMYVPRGFDCPIKIAGIQ